MVLRASRDIRMSRLARWKTFSPGILLDKQIITNENCPVNQISTPQRKHYFMVHHLSFGVLDLDRAASIPMAIASKRSLMVRCK